MGAHARLPASIEPARFAPAVDGSSRENIGLAGIGTGQESGLHQSHPVAVNARHQVNARVLYLCIGGFGDRNIHADIVR